MMLKVRPRNRVLVEMLPFVQDIHNPLALNLISHKKHWEGTFRRGKVLALDPRIQWRIPEVKTSDVVIMKASAGFTLDGDVLDEDDKFDAPLKGEGVRWLHWKEIEAIDETSPETLHA